MLSLRIGGCLLNFLWGKYLRFSKIGFFGIRGLLEFRLRSLGGDGNGLLGKSGDCEIQSFEKLEMLKLDFRSPGNDEKGFLGKIGHAGIGFQELGNAEILFQVFRKLEKQVF